MNENNENKTPYDLKSEIKNIGMNQKEFAGMIDIHINTVSQWVRGINEIPTWVKLLIYHYRRSMFFEEFKEKAIEIEKKGGVDKHTPFENQTESE